jgi:hypothetical protein
MSLDTFNVLTDYLLQITIIQIIRMFFIFIVYLCDLVDKIRDDDILFFSQILIENLTRNMKNVIEHYLSTILS